MNLASIFDAAILLKQGRALKSSTGPF